MICDMEKPYAPIDTQCVQVISVFNKKYHDQVFLYWKKNSHLRVAEIEDAIADSTEQFLLNARTHESPKDILNCKYLMGIIRNKVLEAIKKQQVVCDDDVDTEFEETKCNARLFCSIDELQDNFEDDGPSNAQFARYEFDKYYEELEASSMTEWRRRVRRCALRLFLSMEPSHQMLFRYHYGIRCKKLHFDEIALLLGFKNADVAKSIFDRKKKQLIQLAKKEKDTLCTECPSFVSVGESRLPDYSLLAIDYVDSWLQCA